MAKIKSGHAKAEEIEIERSQIALMRMDSRKTTEI